MWGRVGEGMANQHTMQSIFVMRDHDYVVVFAAVKIVVVDVVVVFNVGIVVWC